MERNGPNATWTSGPTTTKTATGAWKILPMSPSLREGSCGHVAIREGMQTGAERVNMMCGLNGRVLDIWLSSLLHGNDVDWIQCIEAYCKQS